MYRLSVALLLAASAAHADTGVGTIKGTVLYEGEPPDRPTQKRTDPYCAKTPGLGEDVVVNKGKLRDVVVRIKNGTTGAHTAPADPVVIDQRGCTYAPHVVGVMAGQKLAIRNSDGTFHNVHGTVHDKTLWNKPQEAKGPELSLETGAADDVIELKCDVHAWMHAWVVVQDSPYFAVTGDDGSFVIKDLPVGTYTLEAWHPTLGTRTLTVKIGTLARGQVTARFSYKSSD